MQDLFVTIQFYSLPRSVDIKVTRAFDVLSSSSCTANAQNGLLRTSYGFFDYPL